MAQGEGRPAGPALGSGSMARTCQVYCLTFRMHSDDSKPSIGFRRGSESLVLSFPLLPIFLLMLVVLFSEGGPCDQDPHTYDFGVGAGFYLNATTDTKWRSKRF